MCGIAGILSLDKDRGVREDMISRMLSVIRYRGPDEQGLLMDGPVGLGHVRLSIIDLSSGHQPMRNEDGSIWITFNGEIFNYIELRHDLRKRGHIFSTQSDTEVILHLYEEYGEQCLQHLNGQFAFAIWDKRSKSLFLARDRIGIRPLFYTKCNGSFYFASEIKSLFATGEIDREIDPLALDQIFTLWFTVPPRTAFRDIRELPPAHYIIVKDGNVTTKAYWDLAFSDELGNVGFDEACERLKELLVDASRLRLRADVPVGAYLSGGLDSSVTTAIIRNFTDAPLQTFSVSFEDGNYDESAYQKEMSSVLGTEHHELRCTYGDICLDFPKVIWHTEKPIIRTAPTPLFMLSKLVRESNFKVVLTGEGADEILGGYDIFKETKIRHFWSRSPDSIFRPLLLKRLYPYLPAFQGQSAAYREAFFNEGLSDPSDLFFSHKPRWQTTAKSKVFFSRELCEEINGAAPENAIGASMPEPFSSWQPFARAQYLETRGLLPGYILSSQGDRVSMAHSIEGRFPFLDHRVVEFCSRLPVHYKMRGLREKHILKETMKPYLPCGITRRTKQPYLAPDSKSFFHDGKSPDYVEELLSEEYIKRCGYFKPRAVGMLVKKCKKGVVIGFKDNMALVGILSTQLLHRQFVEDFKD